MFGVKIKNNLQISEMFTISWQKFSGGYFFKGESHDFYEVVCVLNGKVGIAAGKNIFVLSENQMTIHRPGEFHAIWEEGCTEPECIIFSFSALHFPQIKGRVYGLEVELSYVIKNLYDCASEIFITDGAKTAGGSGEGSSVFKHGVFITGIRDGKEEDVSLFVKRLEIFLASAMQRITEEDKQNRLQGSGSYKKIMSVMEENLDKNLSLNKISQLCGMSVPALEKTVFKYLHIGAIAYYNALKMEKACLMLQNGLTVKETSINLGFSNQNYFSARFKKRFGYPPSKLKGN